MTDLEEAREILAQIEAGIAESDRLRAESERLWRERDELQRKLARQREALLASL
jgi:hypothetical protein